MTVPGETKQQSEADAEHAEPESDEREAHAGEPTAAAAEMAPETESPNGVTSPDGVTIETIMAELDAAQTDLADAREQALRARAEVENVRRRAEQEVAKVRKFAVEGFANELLSVKDSLDLAANVDLGADEDPVVRNMHEGLALTRRQLDTAFEKFGISALEPEVGEKLNPDLHQAMSLQESNDVPAGHILHVVQKGFTLKERLLRPAMVIVAKAPAA